MADGQAVMSEDNDIAPVGVWRFRCEVDGIDLDAVLLWPWLYGLCVHACVRACMSA